MAKCKHPVVSILIVSYNTRQLTLACLDSIVRETAGTPHEIIVVDNASTDGSPEAILAHPAAARLIALGTNIGFARANNIGARAATADLVLLLNPDTLVKERAIDRLVGFSRRRPQARIWGGRTLFADGSLNPASAWARLTIWRLLCRALGLTGLRPRSALFNGEAFGGWQRDSERAVDIVSGCFLLIERELWDELGGFDPSYFMYGEDADLCLRAIGLGARPRITPEAAIVHYGGASERVRADKMVRLLAAKASLILRHFPAPLAPIGIALHAAWPLSRAIACALADRLPCLRIPSRDGDTWREVWRRRREWIDGYPGVLDTGGTRGAPPSQHNAERGGGARLRPPPQSTS
jgi:hypothetical protein